MSFINLHNHTAKGSLLDSILTVDQMIDFCVANNQPAIALTDHGTLSSFVDFYKACTKKNILPIIGCELYEVDDDQQKNDTKDNKQPRYHLIVLAKNRNGLKNLLKIVSYAGTDGKYIKPRISVDRIIENGWGKDIVCMTACQAGRLSRLVCSYKIDEAKQWVSKLQTAFDYVAVEIQSHKTDSQYEANYRLLEFAKQNGLPFAVSCDAHYLSPNKAYAQSKFVLIGEDREVGESYVDCYLQSENDVRKTLSDFDNEDISKAIEETAHITSMIEEYDIGMLDGFQMPKTVVPEGYSSHMEYLRYLIYSTFDRKFSHLSEEEQQKRRDRIEMELPVIEYVDYVDYFLMVHDLLAEARAEGVVLGPARGSAAGCLCLFMLDVTQIDSVLWDLDFARFASRSRKGTLADIDIDIARRDRKKLIRIAERLFGEANVAPICTFNTLSTKVAIRDLGKCLNEDKTSPYFNKIPYAVRNEVASAIPAVKSIDELGQETEKELLLKDLVSHNPKLQHYYEEFPLWFELVMELESLPKSLGTHAAGCIIAPKPIVEYAPLCNGKDGMKQLSIEMNNCMTDLKLVKMDFLGLKTLDTIDDTLTAAGLTWNDVNFNTLDFYDKATYDATYGSSNCTCCFQFESSESQQMCVEAKADSPLDVIAISALNRPGAKDSFPEYCKNKFHPESADVVHPDLLDLYAETHGVLIYQEECMAIFRYAGFEDDSLDDCRKAISKKKVDVMAKMEPQFKAGLKAKGWTEEQSNKMWDLVLKQAGYSFNKSHACAYGLLSFITAYLKTHYPVEYLSSCLTQDSGNSTRISVIINEARRLGIKVLPPNINKSNRDFTPLPDKNSILFGLLAIKGLGENVVDQIIANRPYKSFDEFLSYNINKTAVISLIKAGCFTISKKEQLLESYCNRLITRKEYKEVSTLPSKTELLMKWGINTDDYKEGRKINKELLIRDFNLAKRIQFEASEQERYEKELTAFKEKYAQDPWLWEFDLLGLFITSDPLEFAYDKIRDFETIDNDTDAVLIGVIVGIQRKKDRHNQLFCYIQLYTDNNIREAICWASTTKQYLNLIKNGNCIAIYGRKTEGGNIIVNEMKLYKKWLEDKQLKHIGVNA